MTEPMLTDLEESLLAYVENRASEQQRQTLEKRLQSDPVLRVQVLGMMADRLQLQESPHVAMPQAWQSKQALLKWIQRQRRQQDAWARIRYGAMAVAALLLASAISFRIIWPASPSIRSGPHMLAISSTSSEGLPSHSPILPSSHVNQVAVIRSAPVLAASVAGAPVRPGALARQPRGGASAPWTLIIAVKNSAQNRQLGALLAKFARQNKRLQTTFQGQAVHHSRMAAAAQQLSLPRRAPAPTTQAIPSPQAHALAGKQRAIHAMPAGDLLVILQPAQIQLLRSQFTVMQVLAPVQSQRAENQEKPTAAFGFRLANEQAAKKGGAPATNIALQKQARQAHASLRRQNITKSTVMPTQAERFIIEILPPRRR